MKNNLLHEVNRDQVIDYYHNNIPSIKRICALIGMTPQHFGKRYRDELIYRVQYQNLPVDVAFETVFQRLILSCRLGKSDKVMPISRLISQSKTNHEIYH